MTFEETVTTTVKAVITEAMSELEEKLVYKFYEGVPEYMNYTQASEYVGVSVGTMRKFVSENGLPIVRLEGVVRLRKTDIDSFLQKHIV
ncbi:MULTISPECIES: helix-turn-helix domain-containing protein [Enterococcus]|uniref:helix-turn-helix domain-containing protein n=1 Tax=Enterococcus TaxID=1350 RepID=UPI000EE7DB31|nr:MULTISPECIES: helix-turn-helix domain-containing protein [Enterococcus]HCM86300.1 DNA-binding protein [Enterococcus sp.]